VNAGVQRLLGFGRNTSDLDRALAFYTRALGFRVIECRPDAPTWTRLAGLDITPRRAARLALGRERIELLEIDAASPYPSNSTAADGWFQHVAIVVTDMEAAYHNLIECGATAITRNGPVRLPPSTGSVTAFKFRDPDGHPLELIAFPPGTGDPIWQEDDTGAATLGIDHSAISVPEPERSIGFYEQLGFHIAARSLNRGIEQERLDALGNVEVEVIGMQADTRTPHLELLAYRHPHGRALPSRNTGAVASDRLICAAEGLDALLDRVRAFAYSDAIVASGRIDGCLMAVLRDPDGHLAVLRDAANSAELQ
jgi:catechol 2,3-dioxygenase-like lactoylglutathione lyase family enzyme